eukprot:TRINITY_DN35060_c0_g1_i1.p1 TRINITY_DN35060_c0_g1~~TRINITY_DN35060_c0_g1_i1.p1  ORF type:complete len:233 (+),score=31.47 TRINITY_DN35060_c0_g1_i1:61-759(+)
MTYSPPPALTNMMMIAPGQLATTKVSAAPVVVDEKRLNKVYVSPLGQGVSEETLKFFFEGCGPILRATVHQSKGENQYGFIEFTNQEDAKKAIAMSGLNIGEFNVKVQPCQDQKDQSTDLFGLRPADKTEAELKEEWERTHELAATAAAYERWQAQKREEKARAIQERTIRRLKKQARKRAYSSESFDSAVSTPKQQSKKQRKRGKRRARSASSGSASSSLPSPPVVFYQGP